MKELWKGIKKAVSNSRRCPHYWRIYADFDNGKVWCNEYTSENDWTNYSNPNIKQVAFGYGYCSIFGLTVITVAELREILEY